MNHDEKNLNPNSGPDVHPWIEPELEARVVAWVAGEASPFEIAELERLCAEKPELALFKRRIEAVHGFVGEATRPDREPLRLSDERRANLLARLETPRAEPKDETPPRGNVLTFLPLLAARRSTRRWLLAAAACIPIAATVLVVRSPGGKKSAQPVSEAASMKVLEEAQSRARETHELEQTRIARNAAATAESAPVDTIAAAAPRTERDAAGGADAPAPEQLRFIAGAARTSVGQSVVVPSPPRETNAPSFLSNELPVAKAKAAAATATAAPRAFQFQFKDQPPPVTITESKTLSLGADASGAGPPLSVAGSVGGDVKTLGAPAAAATDSKRDIDADAPLAPRPPAPASPDVETSATAEPFSTFSLHARDVSFRLAQAALARGELPDASRIRPEEFYNAFDYGEAAPSGAEKIGCHIQQAAHPFLQQRNLVRIAMKVPATGRTATTPLRLTVLLDTSGSMARADHAAAVRAALKELISLLGPNDRITLIGFAREPHLLAESVRGDQAGSLLELIARAPAEGGANLEVALHFGEELAQRQQLAGAQNRIVLLTGGAANLGGADAEQLAKSVEALRRRGIAFDACGIGLEGLADATLEALTRRGDGRYYALNSVADVDAGFARQLAGAFRPATENVKLQVRFNSARVGRYRLIGFEQHRLRPEDFRNDQVGATELAAEEAAVALYQIEVLPQGSGDLGEVFVRFRDTTTGTMIERSWALPYEPGAPAFDRATPTLQLAGTAALLAEKLRGGPSAAGIKLAELAPIVSALRSHYASEPRVQELVAMYEQLRRLLRE
jgi:hypothetical protein